MIVQDADLEYDPADYPKLLAPLLQRFRPELLADGGAVRDVNYLTLKPHQALMRFHPRP